MTRTNSPRSAGKATALLLAAALVAVDRAGAAARLGGRDACFPARATRRAIAAYQLRALAPDDYAAAIRTGARRGRRRPRRQPARACPQAIGAAPRRRSSAKSTPRSPQPIVAHGRATPGTVSSPAMPKASRRWQARWPPTSAASATCATSTSRPATIVAGDDVDTTTVALAAVGITLTVATVFSLGATLPEKAGVSTVKIVNRAGPPVAAAAPPGDQAGARGRRHGRAEERSASRSARSTSPPCASPRAASCGRRRPQSSSSSAPTSPRSARTPAIAARSTRWPRPTTQRRSAGWRGCPRASARRRAARCSCSATRH